MPLKHEFHYDLDLSMQPTKGTVSFDKTGQIISSIDEKTLLTLSGSDIAEISVIGGVGCGFLFAKMNDDSEILICRFTLSSMKAAGEFCKVINFYNQTKQYVPPEEKVKPVCEKCGRPLVEGMSVCLFCYNKLSVLKRAFDLLRPFAKKLMRAEVFLATSSIIYLLVPFFSRILIDDYLRPMKGTSKQVFY